MRIIISAFDDGSYKIDHSDIDAHITAAMPDYIASGEVDVADWAATIEAQFENDPAGAIEEGVARGFALGLANRGDQLIAAAPDLYAALSIARNILVANNLPTTPRIDAALAKARADTPNVSGLSHTGVDRR